MKTAKSGQRLDHPTRIELIELTTSMLEDMHPNQLKANELLRRSGISKGSLYHHFEDFGELVEVSMINLFSKYIDTSLEQFRAALTGIDNKDQAESRFLEFISFQHFRNDPALRQRRITLLNMAIESPRLHAKLRVFEEELTQKWIEVYQLCLERGWADPELDPRSVSVLLQSSLLGRILDDLALDHPSDDVYVATIAAILLKAFFGGK